MPDISLTKHFLSNSRFFSAFSETDLDRFLNEVNIKIYRKNSNLFLRGDKIESFYVVLNGWVKLHRETPEGEDAIVALLTKGDVFDKSVLFGEEKHLLSALTLTDVSIAEIPMNLIREVATCNIKIMEKLLAIMSKDVYDLQMENEHLSIMSAPQRVGCLILKLSYENEMGRHITDLPYDKSLAAAKLGMKPETFSRALAQLRDIGVVAKGSTIIINDVTKLASYCCRHCSSVLDEFASKQEAIICDGNSCCMSTVAEKVKQ